MSLLFSQRVHTSSTTLNLKYWRKAFLGLMVLVLATLSPPAVVNAVTTPSVAPGITPDVRYYHPDATGNLVAMTDEGGQVAWRGEVRPFGQGTANPQNYPLRFLDQPLEAEIGAEGGLYHLGARTYDPVAGRFLTTDPLPLIGILLEEPQRFNRYAYGLNNPYRYMDPTGLAPPDWRKGWKEVKPRVTGKPDGPRIPVPKVFEPKPLTEVHRPLPDPAEQIPPVRTGDATTPSLGEAPVEEGEFDAQDTDPDPKKRLAEELNRLNCAYGMDFHRCQALARCRPDHRCRYNDRFQWSGPFWFVPRFLYDRRWFFLEARQSSRRSLKSHDVPYATEAIGYCAASVV